MEQESGFAAESPATTTTSSIRPARNVNSAGGPTQLADGLARTWIWARAER